MVEARGKAPRPFIVSLETVESFSDTTSESTDSTIAEAHEKPKE